MTHTSSSGNNPGTLEGDAPREPTPVQILRVDTETLVYYAGLSAPELQESAIWGSACPSGPPPGRNPGVSLTESPVVAMERASHLTQHRGGCAQKASEHHFSEPQCVITTMGQGHALGAPYPTQSISVPTEKLTHHSVMWVTQHSTLLASMNALFPGGPAPTPKVRQKEKNAWCYAVAQARSGAPSVWDEWYEAGWF